ncbi:MAG TPA: peptidoglycan recognition family protein [Blastocatellia bacterium]
MDLEKIPFVQARWLHRGRIGQGVKLICIHTAECPMKPGAEHGVAQYFRTSERQASAHFTVSPSGIVQSVRTSDTAWAAKNANSNGVHIEHTAYAAFTNEDWNSEQAQAMLDLSAQLAAELCKEFDIPVRRARFKGLEDPAVVASGLCGHVDVPLHGSHSDPGKSFPWEHYLERVSFHLA